LGELKGNVEGENGGSGPIRENILRYPEYFNPVWFYTEGHLNEDSRHKVRVWATYDAPLPETWGSASIGVLQFFSSGAPYRACGPVDTPPFVTNPGYPAPPASANYYFTAREPCPMPHPCRTH